MAYLNYTTSICTTIIYIYTYTQFYIGAVQFCKYNTVKENVYSFFFENAYYYYFIPLVIS